VSEDEFLDDFRPMEEGEIKGDEESGNTVPSTGAGGRESTNWEKRAEAELENGMREPPVAMVV